MGMRRWKKQPQQRDLQVLALCLFAVIFLLPAHAQTKRDTVIGDSLTVGLHADYPPASDGTYLNGFATQFRNRLISARSFFVTAAAEVPEARSLIVTSNADIVANDGETTLREAIDYARTFPSAQTPIVSFASHVTGTITLNGSNLNISRPVGSSLTISGPGAGVLSLNGNAQSNIFYSDGVGNAAVSGLTFTNGLAAKGGAIQTVPNANDFESSGILSVTDCVFSGNHATTEAGAINGGCVLRLLRCKFLNNISDNFQGAVQFFSYAQNRPSSATDCIFNGNSAQSSGGALAIYSDGTTVLTNCVFNGNSVADSNRGGAIQLNTDPDDLVNFNACTFNDNRAISGEGGALSVFFCPRVTLTNCTLSNNRANKGAAVSTTTSSGVFFIGCTLNGNAANSAGGGVWSTTPLSFINSTLSGNTANGSGGAIALSVPQSNAALTTQFTTFTNNSASNGGAIDLGSGSGNLARSIVAGNSANSNPDLRGAYVSGGFNVIGKVGSATGFGANDRVGTVAAPLDARLEVLANNDGPTLTHALMADSPALNLATPLAAITTDQRGFPRSASSHNDAGSFEVQIPVSTLAIDLNGSPEGKDVTTAFSEQTPIVIAPNIVLTNNAELSSATVQLNQNPDNASEILNANVSGTQISANYNAQTRTLNLNGNDSIAHYQQVLASVRYNNLSDTPNTTNRTLVFAVNSGENSANATATLTVNAIDDAPVASPQNLSTNEDTPFNILLGATDVDTPIANLTFRLVTPPAHGTLSGTAPSLIYTPSANFNGADAFSFVASDGASDSNIAQIALQVLAINDAPIAHAQQLSTDEDTPLNIVLSASDIETPVANLNLRIVAAPEHGTLSGTAPNLIYTPDVNFNGADRFTFTANDGALDSNLATIELQVLAVNDAPVAIRQQLTADNATPLRITLGATDVDNDTLSFDIIANPQNGTLSGNIPNLIYSAKAGFLGKDAFTFRVSDGVASAQASVEIAVGGDAAVSATDDDFSLILGAPGQAQASGIVLLSSGVFQIQAPGVLRNDSFPAGRKPTVRALNNPSKGRFQLRNDGTLFYLPSTGKIGVDEFTYAISDGKTTATARVRLNVIDQRAPELAFDTPRDRETVSQFSKIAGRVRDRNAGLKIVTLLWQRFDGKFWNGKSWVAAPTELPLMMQGIDWSYKGPLPKLGANATTDLLAGRYDLRITATDNSDNINRVTNRIIVAETAPQPSNVRLSSANASTAQNAIALNFSGALDVISARDTKNYKLAINGAAMQIGAATYANNVVTLSGLNLRAGDKIELQIAGLRDASGKVLASGTFNLIAR